MSYIKDLVFEKIFAAYGYCYKLDAQDSCERFWKDVQEKQIGLDKVDEHLREWCEVLYSMDGEDDEE